MSWLNNMMDSFQNFMSGLGTEKDKAIYHEPILNVLTPMQLMNLYRGDWLSRKIVDLPAFDSTRAWRSWQAEQDQIEHLEATERSLGLQMKLMHAFIRARLWGGSLIILGVDHGSFDEPLEVEKIGKGDLKFVHVLGRYQVGAGPLIRDVTSPWYGQPQYYYRSNIDVGPSPDLNINLPQSSLGYKPGSFFYIHPSRAIRIIGAEYPDMELAPDPWGDSILQVVYDAVRDTNLATSSIAAMLSEAKFDVIKVPGLTNMMSNDEGTAKLVKRFGGANLMKSMVNAVVMDAAETWEQNKVNMAGYDKVMSLFMLMACGAADIPATRVMGREPAGMNATGESDMRNYYDRLSSEQVSKYTPALTPLDEVMIRSTFGDRDPDIYYQWNPLWQMSDEQKSQIWLRKAQAFQIHANSGLLDEGALRQGLENQLIEDGVYPSLESAIDDLTAAGGEDVDQIEPDTDADEESTIADSAAKPLYVYRPLLNAVDIRKWAKTQGFKSVVTDPHVTLVYSKQPVDWMKMGDTFSSGGIVKYSGGPRVVEQLGDEGAAVLHFSASDLKWRHDELVRLGCSHDYDEYQPHLTISYDPGDVDLDAIEPYDGELRFGPEKFAPINTDPSKPFKKPQERKL